MLSRRDLGVAVLSALAVLAGRSMFDAHAAHAAPASSAVLSASAPKPPMRSRVFDSPKIKAEPTPYGGRREVFDAPTATLERFASHITTLNAGQAPHPAHKHPEEELMILKEGTLEVTLNGQATRVEAGGMIFCASNEMHGLRNIGTTPATYYVIKWFPHDLPKSN
ncbi:MAG TPA: cupin domain-containing protein [Polyangiaceae bacterium]|jgi:mannose-6-phosphate isomerase-like protein (cupin superfamily)